MHPQTVTLSSDPSPVRIVIAAAQSPFRELLRSQLESEPGVQVVGDAPDTRTACVLTRRLKPDILLIECALNREFSARCSLRQRNSRYAAGIVVIIEGPRIHHIVEAFELGAKGVVLRASLPLVWRTGIQRILAGQYWVEDTSVALLLGALRGFLVHPEINSLPGFGLTLREMEIARKIAVGRSNKDVGREFSICERTVKHHLTNIFKKVGVSSRLELAVIMRDKMASQQIVSGGFQHPSPTSQDGKNLEKPRPYLVTEP